jgi:hypothetical protein
MSTPSYKPGHTSSVFPRALRFPFTQINLPGQLRIVPPDVGNIRFRKIIGRSAQRPTFKHPSIKLGRSVHTESVLELDTARMLEACPSVSAYAEQPFCLEYVADGVARSHVPDFAFEYQGKPVIREVKYLKDVDQQVRARTDLLKAMLARFGVDYGLSTEASFSRVGLANAKALLLRARRPSTQGFTLGLIERLRSGERLVLGDLDWNASGRDEGSAAREIVEARLHVNLTQPLELTTPVRLMEDGEEVALWH